MLITVLALWAMAETTSPKPGWKAYADCAAAYRANSQLPDPKRTSTMRADIVAQANDYQGAARKRLRQTSRQNPVQAEQTVADYVEGRLKVFGRQSRSKNEHFIDACPQLDG